MHPRSGRTSREPFAELKLLLPDGSCVSTSLAVAECDLTGSATNAGLHTTRRPRQQHARLPGRRPGC